MSAGAMKGEAQLINLMHCRYVDALKDMVSMMDGDLEARFKAVDLANKLSTINVDNYFIKWGQRPNPQKILAIDPDGNILSTDKYLDA